MAGNYLVITALGIVCGLSAWFGGKILPRERWQFFATIPVRKLQDNTWEGANITWYGMILSGATVFAVAIYLAMLGAVGVSLVASLGLMAVLLLICVPASSLIARLVETKPATLTIGGAVFVGMILAPFIILLLNRVSARFPGMELPVGQTLAACSIAFLFGEGMGRLACLSYGCCYGKPVEHYRGLLRSVFERTALVFYGNTKKIAYASGLEGRRVIPIQLITMYACSTAGVVTLLLFAGGHYLLAYVVATVFAGAWRIVSELFRNDYRGGTRISAYQIISGISIVYAACVSLYLADAPVSLPVNLLTGVLSLWSPGVMVILSLIWLLLLVFAGISRTTFSRVAFHLHRDRI